MSIDEKTVRKVAKLARLALPEERVKPMADELNGIMAWIEQLNEVDIEGVEPMTSAVEGLSLPMREDVVTARRRSGAGAEERAEERRMDSSCAEGGGVSFHRSSPRSSEQGASLLRD